MLSLEIAAGQVRASVQGSRTKPYRVFIETEVLRESEWDGIEGVMASRAVFLATLLSGEMPEQIEEAFVESSTTLFPGSRDDLVSACSCPDWENPCKHIAAVFYLMAEAFDDDPFLIFAWRGRTKDALLANLRTRRRGGPAVGVRSAGATTEASGDTARPGAFGWPVFDADDATAGRSSGAAAFWGRHEDMSIVEVRPRLAVAADLALRQLDPSPLGDSAGVIDQLRPLYDSIASGAIALAFPEEPDTRS